MAASKITLGNSLRELRVILCQTSQSSEGVRNFIEKHYVPLKKANPQIPILVRECSGVQPKIYARYEFGKELNLSLANETVENILKHVANLAHRKP